MHETVIANKIINAAKKEKEQIKKIEIEVGELGEITSDELKTALSILTDWNIKINEVKNKIKCDCGYIGKARIVDKGHGYCIFNCPKCGKKPVVLEGGEIKIIGIE